MSWMRRWCNRKGKTSETSWNKRIVGRWNMAIAALFRTCLTPRLGWKSSPGPFHTQDRARDDLARSAHIVLDYCWRLLTHLRHLRTLSLATPCCPKHGDPNPAPPHPWARADLRLRDTWEAFDVAIDTASLMMGHHWYFVLNDIVIDNHQKLSTAIVLVVTYVSLLILQLKIK